MYRHRKVNFLTKALKISGDAFTPFQTTSFRESFMYYLPLVHINYFYIVIFNFEDLLLYVKGLILRKKKLTYFQCKKYITKCTCKFDSNTVFQVEDLYVPATIQSLGHCKQILFTNCITQRRTHHGNVFSLGQKE